MSLLSILSGLLSLANKLAEYLSRKQLIDAGEAKAIAKGLQETHERIIKAKEAANRKLDDDKRKRMRERYNLPDDTQ